MRRFAWTLVAIAIASACGSDEHVQQTTPTGEDAGTPVKPTPEAGTDSSQPPLKRQVFQKNPFGNVAASDNMLWDGDFEWASAFADQYGWVDASPLIGVSTFQGIRASARCRSGMKCAFMTQNQRMAGIGVSPGGSKVSASIWASPPNGACADLTISMIACDFGDDPDVPLTDADDAPDADGWCHYEAIGDVRQRSTCIYVVADFADGEAIVDDAVVRPAPASAIPSSLVPSAAEQARIEEARKVIRERLRPAPPRPTPAAEALTRFLARRR